VRVKVRDLLRRQLLLVKYSATFRASGEQNACRQGEAVDDERR
jgi:hypothetical protein